jgi:hypothetical protein
MAWGTELSMSAPAEKLSWSQQPPSKISTAPIPDRRVDIDDKQLWIAELLREIQCEGLLVQNPENFSWLTSGGAARGILDPAELPMLFFSPNQRCILANNVDSQRLFDEEVDGLGFQLKEWPWYWGRERLLLDLCQGRRIASDEPFADARVVGDRLRQRRRALSPYEQACYRSLGQIVSHALEAACRTVTAGDTEREVAGQLGHRLLHRGAHPVSISVAADGRSRVYRQSGFTSAAIQRFCVLGATVRKYGLYITASRSVSLGPPDERLQQEHEAACRINATYAGATWADAVPSAVLSSGRHIYLVSGFEHEWRLSPQGFVTGRSPVELPLLPNCQELLRNGWALTWQASVGAATVCDTYMVTDRGPELMTPTEAWPLKLIRFHGADILLPCLLER